MATNFMIFFSSLSLINVCQTEKLKIKCLNSPECRPVRGEPSRASPEDLPPAPRLLLPVHDGAAAGRPDTPAADLSSERGVTATEAPRPRSASAGSATPPAGAGGGS